MMDTLTIIVIVLGWLLFNTWLTYLICALAKSDVRYNEFQWLILASIITPITVPIINIVMDMIRNRRKDMERKEK